jgi:hypothetical protein
MARLQRPLNPQAVQEADNELYARHFADPRPNALYDAEGLRRPLDPRDPAQADLRQEWCDLYNSSLNQPSQSQTQPPTPPTPPKPPPADLHPAGNRPVSKPVEPCAPKYGIRIQLIRLPDVGERPTYWPTTTTGPYASERYSAEITDGHHDGSLDGQGSVRFDNIPSGSCSIRFPDFYVEIERYFDQQLQPVS